MSSRRKRLQDFNQATLAGDIDAHLIAILHAMQRQLA